MPRVRDTDAEEERSLGSYQTTKSAEVGPELVEAILLGISQGDYQEIASQLVDGFGLSQTILHVRGKSFEIELIERPLSISLST